MGITKINLTMARADNYITDGIRGQVGKKLVFKRYKNKTIISKFPDMSRVKPSKAQKKKRTVFAKAVLYAQSILGNPKLKAAKDKERRKKGRTLYHHLIGEYILSLKNKKD